jgi:hypothetical protein
MMLTALPSSFLALFTEKALTGNLESLYFQVSLLKNSFHFTHDLPTIPL